MDFHDAIAQLTGNLVIAYDTRVKAATALQAETQQMLRDYQSELQDMANRQQEALNKNMRDLQNEVGQRLAEQHQANQEMTARQREHLDEFKSNLRHDTGQYVGDARAARSDMSRTQQEQLNAYKQNLHKSVGDMKQRTDDRMAEIRANHQAAANAQRQQLGETRNAMANQVAAARASNQAIQGRMRADFTAAGLTWQTFSIRMHQQRTAKAVPSPSAPAAAAPAPPEAPAHDAQQPQPLSDTGHDMTRIRGIGQGMQQRLKRAGIETYQELAAKSPDEVRQALGEVGRLANVEEWIAHAQELATQPPEG